MSGTCASCGHPLDGRYCARCGEQHLDPAERTVWHFVTRSLPAEVFDLDGKIWRSLRLLIFSPGFLASEYAAGRHRPYVRPLRLFLTAIVVYALITAGTTAFTLGVPGTDLKLSTVPVAFPAQKSIGATLFQVDRFGVLERLYVEQKGPVEQATDDDRERFNGLLNAIATVLSFTSVLLLASVLYVCFHRSRPLFVEHVVLSMHYLAFLLASQPVLVGVMKSGLIRFSLAAALPLMAAILLWQIGYLGVSLRRFYFPGAKRVLAWPLAAALGLLFFLLNAFFITALQFAAGLFAIWSL
jgi:hypothetical protein